MYKDDIRQAIYEAFETLKARNELKELIKDELFKAINEDKWITIKPNGEENKGRHLLIKEGESVHEAMQRTYGIDGAKGQQKLFDTKGDRKTKEDFKREKEEKQKKYDEIDKIHQENVKKEAQEKEEKKNKAIQDYINGKITSDELEKIAPDLSFWDFMDLAEKKHAKEDEKKSESKEDNREKYKKGNNAKITEKRFENLFVDSALENNQYRITKVLSNKEHVVFDKKRGQIIFYKQGDLSDSKNYSAPKGTVGMLEEFRTSDYDKLVDYLFEKGEKYRFELLDEYNANNSKAKNCIVQL